MDHTPSAPQEPTKPVTRRDFLKTGATAAVVGTAALMLKNTALAPTGRIPASAAGEETIIKTTCTLCPSGCGLEVRVVGGKAVKIEGNPLHPINQGVCCLKGQTALEALYSPERIARPRLQTGKKGEGKWKEISWEEALALVAEKLGNLRRLNQAHTLALVHGETRGQERAVLQHFMAAFGSPNLVSSASLGEQTARQAMYLTQGINGLPVYDFNNSNYIMTFGGNLLESSRNVIATLGSVAFMRRGRPNRGKLVAVHPRLSLTGAKADEWVPIRPGTYAALALGMASVIINSKLYDEDFVRDFTFGFEDFTDEDGNTHQGFKSFVLEGYPLERAAAITGIAAEIIARLAGEFATNRPAVAVMPTEPGELSSGNSLSAAMAIHALNALVGSVDAKGGVLVQRFPEATAWPEYPTDGPAEHGTRQPRLDGAGSAKYPLAISAVQNVPAAVLNDQPYPIQALLLLNANPVGDAPEPGQWAQALMKVPFVVSFAPTLDDSAAHADLILPVSSFLEEWGDDYIEGGGFAGVSLRQPVVLREHDTRSPFDVLLEVARRLGGAPALALPWQDYRALVRYRLEGMGFEWEKFEGNGCWSEMVYFHAEPGSAAWSSVVGRDRLYAPQDGRFDLFSRELFALLGDAGEKECLPRFELPAPLAADTQAAAEYPFLLISQQLITQSQNWAGIIPTLQECYGLQNYTRWMSWVELNPITAERLHLKDGDEVWVESAAGKVKAVVRLYAGLWPNAVFLPQGMGRRTTVRWGRNSPADMRVGANPNQLLSASSEPLSGQAVFTPTRVKVYRA
jgi:menaquinone reductase, molybdopterin-binding-like subunit